MSLIDAARTRAPGSGVVVRSIPPLAVVVATAAAMGALVGSSPRLGVVSVAGMLAGALALALRPPLITLVLSWLVLAPVLQNDANGNSLGHMPALLLYRLPPLLFLAWMVYDRVRDERRTRLVWQDWLPAALVALIVVSLVVRPPHNPAAAGNPFTDSLYWNLGIPIILYYVCAFGRLGRTGESRIMLALIAGGALSALLGFAERATGVDLWGAGTITALGGYAVNTLTGTLSNPTVFGEVTGASAVLSASLLVWRAPNVWWRRGALVALAITLPATVLTYERAPVVAVVVGVLLIVASRRQVWNAALIFALCAALAGLLTWGMIATSVVERRVSDAGTVQTRVELAKRSVQLITEHPIIGTGYGTFDEVKNLPGTGSVRVPLGLFDTSHNTFLTILVELGVLGFALMVGHWAWVVRGRIRSWRRGAVVPWLAVGWLALVAVYVVNAMLIDMRFFSYAALLPWIALGCLRRGSPGGAGSIDG
ncbi:MAG: O-Antigen ligase [Solirubrobacteraceae bacterium]|nr:O-Antigen ligase [Solirubrobacteraceae bacterium]